MSLADVQWLLANPSPASWARVEAPVAPPNGLFLARVFYDPAHFARPPPLRAAPQADGVDEEAFR